MFDFITDLDAFFCEKYADYDKICVLPNYRMPVMHATEVRADGRTYGYTLPAETMRLALQEEKDALLKNLKSQMVDKTFSFSFAPIGFFGRIRNLFARDAFHKQFKAFLNHYNIAEETAFDGIDVAEEIKTGILKGKFAPTKNFLLSFALTQQISYKNTQDLLGICGEEFDYREVKDVVIAYLLQNKVYNFEMINAALNEYKVANLFLK